MHQTISPDDISAKMLTDRLAAQANAEEWFFSGEGFDHLERNARFGGRTRAGRDQHPIRIECESLFRRDLVVAKYALSHAQLTEVLDEVESKRIEIIDNKQHQGIYRRVDTSVKRGDRVCESPDGQPFSIT